MPQNNKAILLTKAEQCLLNALPDRTIVSLDSIKEIGILRRGSLPTILHRLGRKGFIIRLSKGRYYITKDRTYNRLFVGSNIVENSYIAMESALFVYGAIKTVPIAIQVATNLEFLKVRNVGNERYVLIPFGKLAVGYIISKEGYKISTRGKTLFDCLYKIKYIGYVENLISMISLMGGKDLSEFLYFASKYGNTVLLERAGYLIELSSKAKSKLGRNLIEEIKGMIGEGVVANLKPDSPLKERLYVKSWHIYDNIGLRNVARRI